MFGRLGQLNKILIPSLIGPYSVDKLDSNLKSSTALRIAEEIDKANAVETGTDRIYKMFTVE